MIKKTVTYTDFDGNTITEDAYFHLSKVELIELESEEKDGLVEALNKIVQAEDNHEIFKWFKKIVVMAYGKRSEDGRRFVKNDEIRDDFQYSPMIDEVVLSLLENDGAASEFMEGIMPADIQDASATQAPAKPSSSRKTSR